MEQVKRLPQETLGPATLLSFLGRAGKGFASLIGRGKIQRVSPLTQERLRFEQEGREQFVKLKEKGLSIPVFTL